MGAAKDKGQIKVSVSSRAFDKPAEPPVKERKKLPERIQDIGESIFQPKKVDKDTADRILAYYESERAKNARLENEKIDLKKIIDNFKEKEKNMYFKFYPFWELAYYSNPSKASEVANEFLVNPENSEYRQNINNLMSVMDAYLKVIHFDPSDKEGFRNLYQMEKIKRLDAEKKLSEAKDELQRMKEEIERLKAQKITITGTNLIPVVQAASVIKMEMDFPEIADEIVGKMEKEENIRIEANIASMKEKAAKPKVEKIEVEDSLFINVLKEKGYKVQHSKNPHHDAMIDYENEQIPICFIDYPIEKPEIFDKIMESTNKIFFLFDSKDNFDKGNGKFSRWLLLSGRKPQIKFSLTRFEDLTEKGKLNVL